MFKKFKNWLKNLQGCSCRNCIYIRRHGGYAPCIKKAGEVPKFTPPTPRPTRPPRKP